MIGRTGDEIDEGARVVKMMWLGLLCDCCCNERWRCDGMNAAKLKSGKDDVG